MRLHLSLADALASTLRDWGVRYVFGVSGANIEHLHDAIHRLGGQRLTAVMAKSEIGAAFMADARARVHRTLGVCCSTSGGGMMNLAVGIAESYAESVPVLAIVGQVPTTHEGKGGFQDSSGVGRTVDAMQFWQACTKYVARVARAHDFWPRLREAASAALRGRPGPSVLLIPRDAYELEVGPPPGDFPVALPYADGTSVEEGELERLYERLRRARRPVLVAGSGVERAGAQVAVQAFAQRTRMAVVTTMSSKAAFPNSHPLHLGMVGMAGHPSAHAYLAERADLILAVGTGLNAMTRMPLGPALGNTALVIVNIDAGDASRAVAPEIVVEADARAVFERLLALHERAPMMFEPPPGHRLERYRPLLAPDHAGPGEPSTKTARRHEETSRAPVPSACCGGLLQSEAIEILSGHLPRRGHVLFDAGNCGVAALHACQIPEGVSSTFALGMGGMGYAICGAIGAQLGSPDGTSTLVFCGDGAFLMTGLEVHTAVDLGLPILFVVFNNGMHGMCVTRQRLYFGGRIECTRYSRFDAMQVAGGLGSAERLWVARASTAEELHARLEDYTRGPSRPGVLDLCLDREEIPPFVPFLPEGAPTYVPMQ